MLCPLCLLAGIPILATSPLHRHAAQRSNVCACSIVSPEPHRQLRCRLPLRMSSLFWCEGHGADTKELWSPALVCDGVFLRNERCKGILRPILHSFALAYGAPFESFTGRPFTGSTPASPVPCSGTMAFPLQRRPVAVLAVLSGEKCMVGRNSKVEMGPRSRLLLTAWPPRKNSWDSCGIGIPMRRSSV